MPRLVGGVIHYNRAYCYFMVRNYQAAISDLTKVIELDPADADNYLKRATAYENLSLEKKARDDYRKAAELGSKEAQTRLSAMK
jgi:Tfp pilus assembly protein PilF